MSYSCMRHQYYSPKEPCGACTRERDMQMGGMAQNQAAMMRANQAAQRWPQDVFERLEGERDVAVKMAATYRVALEKVQTALEARPDLSIEAFADTCLQIRRIVNDAGVGPDPSGGEEP